ncbi:unnamed protein product [Closterium sp. NIES-65]|nr:unnamed protein product [Closterium sp. NIES-65]
MSHGLCACLLPLSVRPHSQALPPAPNLCGLRPLTPPTALRRRDLGGLGGDSPNLPFAGEESGGAGLLAARGAFLRGRVARRGPAPARSLGARGSGGVHGGMRRRKRRVWTRRGEEEEAEKGRGGGGSDTDANDLGGVYLRRGVGRGKEGGEREKGKGERERGEVVEGKRGGMGGAGGGRDGKESEKERSDSKEEGARHRRRHNALVVANVNALVAQLLFVFLSGAVFARLTHPVDPILCSKIACITPPLQQPQQQQQGVNVLGGAAGGSGQSPPVRYPPAARSLSRSISSANFGGSAAFAASSSFPAAAGTAVAGGGGAEGGGFGTGGGGMGGGRGCERMLLVRYVLAGPQPCELVDVKVELTLKHNTLSCTGRFFRQVDHLKLVRSEDSYQRYGMTVRHLIDESSPLYGRSRDDLCLVNAQLSLAVVSQAQSTDIGMERASMQPVFHVEDYFVADEDVIWNADFEDMVYRDDKNRLLVDHRKISNWVGIEL